MCKNGSDQNTTFQTYGFDMLASLKKLLPVQSMYKVNMKSAIPKINHLEFSNMTVTMTTMVQLLMTT